MQIRPTPITAFSLKAKTDKNSHPNKWKEKDMQHVVINDIVASFMTPSYLTWLCKLSAGSPSST